MIDVAAGDKIPRKGGPGITQSDLLVINKIDLAPMVGASLEVMDRDARRMRGERPFVFTNLKTGQGLDAVIAFIASAACCAASAADAVDRVGDWRREATTRAPRVERFACAPLSSRSRIALRASRDARALRDRAVRRACVLHASNPYAIIARSPRCMRHGTRSCECIVAAPRDARACRSLSPRASASDCSGTHP